MYHRIVAKKVRATFEQISAERSSNPSLTASTDGSPRGAPPSPVAKSAAAGGRSVADRNLSTTTLSLGDLPLVPRQLRASSIASDAAGPATSARCPEVALHEVDLDPGNGCWIESCIGLDRVERTWPWQPAIEYFGFASRASCELGWARPWQKGGCRRRSR